MKSQPNSKMMGRVNTKQLQREIGKQRLKLWWVAEESGIHRTTLRRWLKKDCPRVGKRRLEKLAAVLNVNAGELLL